MKHLSHEDLSVLLDRPAGDGRRREAERHLEQCARCREALAELESQDRALVSALTHDPGDAYFESFAARVGERIRSRDQDARKAPARSGLVAWLADPRRLSWVGGTAALIAAIGLVMVAAREGGLPDLRRPELKSRSDQVARERAQALPPGPPGSVSTVEADRTGPVEEQRPSPEADAPSGSAANEPAPSAPERVETQQAPRAAAPSRAVRLRRDPQTGEDVPVEGRQSYEFIQPSEGSSSDAPPPAAKEARIPKPRATPLSRDAASSAKSRAEIEKKLESLQSQPARSNALAPEDNRAGNRATIGTESTLGPSRLCGTVRDRGGRPVAGAQVVVANLGLTATTDREGRYCIAAPAGDHTLSVMAMGFETDRRAMRVAPDAEPVDVILNPVAVLGGPTGLDRTLRGGRTALGETAGGESFRTWPPAVAEAARRAQRSTDRALLMRSATLLDRAAGEWAQALERAGGGAAEIEIRARLADARYRAWEMAPNATRRAAADQALVAYLDKAPAGSARESAEKRLERVRR